LVEANSTNFRVYVDLDGVLADFSKGMTRALQTVLGDEFQHSEHKYNQDPHYRRIMWKSLDKYQREHGKEMWYELDLMPDAHILWNFVKGFGPEILTATGQARYNAAEQKRRWVAEKLGSHIPVHTVEHSSHKAQKACPRCILIDDNPKSINPWVEAGGIGILHSNARDSVEQLAQILSSKEWADL
jgi:phosphoglycolate phosphatase-like HAD superfamily hydrolase